MDSLTHRKAEARLRILKADGSPAANETLAADQTSHQFLFGCGAFDAVAMMKTGDEEKRELENRRSIFSMYGGQKKTLKIQFDNELMDQVIDRFGENVECTKNSEDTFVVKVDVQISPTFFAWLFQYGTRARVLEPDEVVRKAQQLLSELIDLY